MHLLNHVLKYQIIVMKHMKINQKYYKINYLIYFVYIYFQLV